MINYKKYGISCFAFLCSFLLLVSCQSTTPMEQTTPGGYTEQAQLSAQDRDRFVTATKVLEGVTYEPLTVATQVVAGTNYKFYAQATTTTLDPRVYYVYVYLFQPLGSDKLDLIDIQEV